MSSRPEGRARFVADRMLGTLTRYLRLMGYDTLSANALSPGNPRRRTRSSSRSPPLTGVYYYNPRRRNWASAGRETERFSISHLRPGRTGAPTLRRSVLSCRLCVSTDRCSLCNTPPARRKKREVREMGDYVVRKEAVASRFILVSALPPHPTGRGSRTRGASARQTDPGRLS